MNPDRQPPYSPESEMSVLGGMLIDADALAKAREAVTPEMFYREANRRLFRAFLRLEAAGVPVDAATLANDLVTHGDLEAVGGMSYVGQLLDAVPTAANIEYHADIVRRKYLRRRLIEECATSIQAAYAPGDEMTLLDEAERRILHVAETHDRGGYVATKGVLWPVFEQVEKRQANPSGLSGLSTGFVDLDEMTDGFRGGDLILVAARPSQGKTAWVLNVAAHVAIEKRRPAGIVSLEMSKESLVQRLLSAEARVDASRLRRGRLDEDEYGRLATAASLLQHAPLYIDDRPAQTLLEVRGKARRLQRQHPDLACLIVDYLQLMRGDGSEGNREQEVAGISRGLKSLAKELGIPVIALSQLSRAVEQRADKRPTLADLRESGSLEQDADVILFLYRPESYYGPTDKEGNSLEGRAEVIIGKQRDGATGTVHLYFRKEITRFESMYPRAA